MANELVKYQNDLNTSNMKGWTPAEMDFFFAVLAKAKNHGTELLQFDAEELKSLAKFENRHMDRWLKVMESTTKKLAQLYYFEKKDKSFRIMSLFQMFDVNGEQGIVKVAVSNYFEYILNHFEKSFTGFPLEEFVQIRSTYAKTMYRMLKQFRTTGWLELKIEDFRYMLDIPKSYNNAEVKRRVLKPIQEELNPFFKNLKIKPIKKRTKGNPIIAYRFEFTPEKTNQWIEGVPRVNPNKPRKAKIEMSVPQYIQDQQAGKITKGDRAETEQIEQLRLQLEKMKQDSPEYPSGYLKEKEGH